MNATGDDDATAKSAREADIEARMEEIAGWWSNYAADTVARTVPKAIQYGSADLDLMGQAMVALAGDKIAEATDSERMQFGRYAACSFYLLGKVARQFGALERGVLPGEDDEFDAMVYAVMQRRIRETGRWV